MNLKQYLPENWAIFHQISTKIDEKWDKNKNNGFGLGPQNLIIKSQHFEWKSMKNQWKLNEISGKIITNL